MKKYVISVLIVLLSCANAGEKKHFYNMTNMQIDSVLTEISAKSLSITEKMAIFSEMFLTTPYNLTCAGDGPYALYEAEPLVNFKESNCMVFCEHVLAMSISDSWDNFFNNLQQIRYKDGMIGMRTRNHYTIGDWLPENNWLLDHVSAEVAGKYSKKMTRTISHTQFFKGKGITDLRYVKPDYEMTVDYVPSDALPFVSESFENGDVLALLFANKNNIFSAHMLMAYRIDGKLIIRESSSSKMTTFDTPYQEWIQKIMSSKRYAGISVMRVKDNLNTSGKIILPWEIASIKQGN